MPKRIVLSVTNKQLQEEYKSGVSTTDLGIKYGCSDSVIYRRLLEKERYGDIDYKNVTGYEIVSINEAMKITGLSRFIITKHMKNGEIPCKRIGNRYMFQLRDIYKMVGIDIEVAPANETTEMDILKDNQQKSMTIENVVTDLVTEMKQLKKSVMNENKEAYDGNMMNSLRIINESQQQINDNIINLINNQNKMQNDLKKINYDIDNINSSRKIINTVVKPINPLNKFGGN